MRAAAQLLHRPRSAKDPAEIARLSAGVQDQDQHAGRLHFRARHRTLTGAEVDRARTEERSLLRCWVMRKTVHLIASEDAAWLLPLYAERFEADARRRLGQLGVDTRTQNCGLKLVEKALADEGPLTREQLKERLVERNVVLDAGQSLHMVHLLTATGAACFGPDSGRRICLIRTEDWLGKQPPHDREQALGELARRYFTAFGPATEDDFAYWSGLRVGEVRAGLGRVASELAEIELDGARAWQPKRRPRLPPAGQLRLLPRFDTYLLGYRSRAHALSREREREINAGGGIIHAAIVQDGRVIGAWGWRLGAGRMEIELRPFERLSGDQRREIDTEIADTMPRP